MGDGPNLSWEQLYRRQATIAVDWYAYLYECVDREQAAREWERKFGAAAEESAELDRSGTTASCGRSPPDGGGSSGRS